jgi:hypothetical protein
MRLIGSLMIAAPLVIAVGWLMVKELSLIQAALAASIIVGVFLVFLSLV